MKRRNVRGAKGAGHPRRNHNGSTGDRRNPPVSTEGGSPRGWHEPCDETVKHGSVSGSGWNSPGRLGVCHEQNSLRQEIGLRSCVIDEGRPSKSPSRRRLQTTLRYCFLRKGVVNGEGKGPDKYWVKRRSRRGTQGDKAKPYFISRQEVLEAYKKVRGRARRNLDQGYSVASRILFRHE
jgi:hypothetical protein